MKLRSSLLAALAALATATTAACQAPQAEAGASSEAAPASAQQGLEKATFAAGCFWCVEEAFDKAEGVVSTTSGYMGGRVKDPTYEQVSAGGTGHAEVVQVVYDPRKIGYPELLNVFWRNVDPVTPNRQFCDVGSQYRSAIFAHDQDQRRLAEASKAALDRSGKLPGPVVTEVVPASEFYPAEEYHQDYYRKNPLRYRFYKFTCGRAQRLEELWGEK